MKRILAAGCLLMSLTGCAAWDTAFKTAEDMAKAPPQAVLTAVDQIVNFGLNLLLTFATTFFAPYLKIFGL